jgi:type IV pilus biogenesis protein CpaD/CtpE
MNPRIVCRIASLLAFTLWLGACSSTPRWDARFGQSLRSALAAQVIDPDAARANRPVNGLDGKAAAAAHERYQHSADAPAALGPLAVGGGVK